MALQAEEIESMMTEKNRLIAIVDAQSNLFGKFEKMLASQPANVEFNPVLTIDHEFVQWDFGTLLDGFRNSRCGSSPNCRRWRKYARKLPERSMNLQVH
jgi:hypothetical protein